jgi:hypothetical protein
MKNCNAPGDVEVTIDMMTAAGPIGRFNKWNDTDDWKKAVIIPVYKKGDKKLL